MSQSIFRRAYGAGGWVRFDGPGLGGTVYLRLVDGEVTQLVVDGDGPVTAHTLRTLPLARLKALASAWPVLHDAAGLLAGDPTDVVKILDGMIHGKRQSPAQNSARLTPTSADGGLTDEFLADVAAAYKAAVARGERPNKALAEQVGTPGSTRTVERWVYLARKKGLLPTTRKGSIG